MHNNAVTSDKDDDEKPGYLYTNTRGRDGLVFTSRNGGWSAEGMEEFNRLCSKVKASRLEDKGSFDDHYREHWIATKRPSKYKRQQPNRQILVATIYNDLEDPDTIPTLAPANSP